MFHFVILSYIHKIRIVHESFSWTKFIENKLQYLSAQRIVGWTMNVFFSEKFWFCMKFKRVWTFSSKLNSSSFLIANQKYFMVQFNCSIKQRETHINAYIFNRFWCKNVQVSSSSPVDSIQSAIPINLICNKTVFMNIFFRHFHLNGNHYTQHLTLNEEEQEERMKKKNTVDKPVSIQTSYY